MGSYIILEDLEDKTEEYLKREISEMSESEKEAFIGGVEMAFDYGLADEIDEYNRKLYHALIAEKK